MTEPTDAVVVLSTAPSEEEAGAIARRLVEERLVACVNLIPRVRSIYSWRGEVHDEGEVLMVMKTRAALGDEVARRVAELHSYTCPEAITLPVVGGAAAYLAWVSEVTG